MDLTFINFFIFFKSIKIKMEQNFKVVDSYGRATIKRVEGKPLTLYEVNVQKFPNELISTGVKLIDKDLVKSMAEIRYFTEKDQFLRDELKKRITSEQLVNPELIEEFISAILADFYGYGILEVFMEDDHLEEIMVNGLNMPVFVVHRKHGMCETNVSFSNESGIEAVIRRIAMQAGRKVGQTQPLLDARMVDGSRANVAIPPAAPTGPSITIRKFRRKPFSATELIKMEALSAHLAAFLWVCIEGLGIHPINIVIAGGAGSGKTTTLNALSAFIPYHERVVTVEDTMELDLKFLSNWVPLEATPSVLRETELDMNALVQNSLRMRPDRVIVGEVRGSEAYTLFVAMDIGLNGSMCTLHANDARETTVRLMNPPMNVPTGMMPLLNLVVVQNKVYVKGKGTIRRITQVSEITGMQENIAQIGDIYKWDIGEDEIIRTPYPIILLDEIASAAGVTRADLNYEIGRRERFLNYLVDKNVVEGKEVRDMIQWYYENPDFDKTAVGK